MSHSPARNAHSMLIPKYGQPSAIDATEWPAANKAARSTSRAMGRPTRRKESFYAASEWFHDIIRRRIGTSRS